MSVEHPAQPLMEGEGRIELLAGVHPNGSPVMETVLVSIEAGTPVTYRLLKSPLLVAGLARGDRFRRREDGSPEVIEHSGNLTVRIYCKGDSQPLVDQLEGDLERLGGDLDLVTPRGLSCCVHVSCGFSAIESLFDKLLQGRDDAVWRYGNVYDVQTGAPSNWWQPLLNEI